MNTLLEDENRRNEIVFIGQALAPFYLEDPEDGDILSAYEAIAGLNIDDAAEEWPFVSTDAARLALTEMKKGLNESEDSQDLIEEYRRLFVGPAPKAAPPWGSVYTDRECVVFGESTLALRDWLRRNGIERLLEEKTPEDHFGLMLLLMVWITKNKPECIEEYLGLHLFTWSSHFLDQLIAEARHPFFKGLAQISKLSLEGIQEEFEIFVEYPRYFR